MNKQKSSSSLSPDAISSELAEKENVDKVKNKVDLTPQSDSSNNKLKVDEGRPDKIVKKISEKDWKTSFKEIEDQVDRFLKENLGKLNEDKCKELIEIIKDRRNNLALSSDIYDQIIKLCQAILAFGAGGLGLSLAFVDKVIKFSPFVQKMVAIAGIFYVELLIVSLLSLTLYMFQARFRYPFLFFTKIGNSFPFFYYSSISPATPRSPFQTNKKFVKGSKLYAKDFTQFATKIVDENDKERLRNELQQYFLLISYQGYVNQFSLQLTNLFLYGVIGTMVSAIIMIISVLTGRL